MNSLDLFSEPYRAAGSIDARAARRAIGRPSLDPWSLFLRETLQNSWDARSRPSGPIDFSVDGWWATSSQLRTLRERVFASRPQRNLNLGTQLDQDEIPILLLTDRRTRGLTGPTRADLTSDERADFVAFVRNIGRDEAKGYGGGTYGFGKGVLYDASACGTILVFTRTHFRGVPVNRFIAIALGGAFDSQGRRYTGRHWWGIENKTTGVEPVTGRRAESLARALGMDTVPPNTTGTAIMVLAPVAHEEEETLEEIVKRIASAATHWAWPHMLAQGGKPSIQFSFSHQGEDLQAPDPMADPVLAHYADAYLRSEAVLSGHDEPREEWPWVVRSIRSERPARRLGALAYRRYRRETVHESAFADLDSHVALMRNPRFVVRYMPVPSDTSGLATAGVFVADPELNDEFAMSEPIAHEDWVPENMRLEKFTRNPVKQALEKLRTEFRQSIRTVVNPSDGGRFAGIASLSSFMGGLLEGAAEGNDASVPRADSSNRDEKSGRATSGSSRPRRATGPSIVLEDRPTLRFIDDRTIAEFGVSVDPGQERLELIANPRVVIDNGVPEAQHEAPVGAEVPSVVGWVDTEEVLHPGNSIVVDPAAAGSYRVRVYQPHDTAVTVNITQVEIS